MTEPYIYRVVEVAKVTDGDTYYLHLDLGFRCLPLLAHIRLYGYDCPELSKGSAYERDMGKHAKAIAATFLTRPELWVQTYKDRANARNRRGAVWAEDKSTAVRTYLGEVLVMAGLATVWPTRWRERYEIV